MVNDIIKITVCEECGGRLIEESEGYVCVECGLVNDKKYVESSYAYTENCSSSFKHYKQYVGYGNLPEFIGNLGSYIDHPFKKTGFTDYNGNPLTPDKQKLYFRLKEKYSKFIRIKKKETDYRILNILADIVKLMNLSPIIHKDAAYYYKKIKNIGIKIRNNVTLLACCIFFAVRNGSHNAPITVKEISEIFKILGHHAPPKLILRDALLYAKYLKKSPPKKSENYLGRLIDCILSDKVISERLLKKRIPWSKSQYGIMLFNESINILKQIPPERRKGRNPFIFAGATIYTADIIIARRNGTRRILTQKIAANAMGIAEYTLRDHYTEIFKLISNLKKDNSANFIQKEGPE